MLNLTEAQSTPCKTQTSSPEEGVAELTEEKRLHEKCLSSLSVTINHAKHELLNACVSYAFSRMRGTYLTEDNTISEMTSELQSLLHNRDQSQKARLTRVREQLASSDQAISEFEQAIQERDNILQEQQSRQARLEKQLASSEQELKEFEQTIQDKGQLPMRRARPVDPAHGSSDRITGETCFCEKKADELEQAIQERSTLSRNFLSKRRTRSSSIP
ncbi:hypothetical protein H2198_002993 [Neophaeococcomyces mojaviensis]|uniref:Uncharacterized protein n=1 Tax=Neophaeococcomyces mojaviensis TaxID=3383035 RepID=A0ACC3ACQ9_9EURO|nr:hypothetical protein H2198_002993 [Knufia sp. JES_112]